MPEPLSRVPLEIVRNTSVTWRYENPDFPVSGGWALSYSFEGPSEITIPTTFDGEGFLATLSVAATASLLVGGYRWQGFATGGAERVLVCSGTIRVLEDLESAVGLGEQKTHAQKVVESLEAYIEGRATDGQLSMSIAGRSLDRLSPVEARKLLNQYRAEMRREEAALRQGAIPGRKRSIKFRFS